MASNNPNYDRNKPKYMWGGNWRGKAPSDKQVAYADKLAAQNNLEINWDQLTSRGEVSHLINDLQMGYRRGYGLFKRDWIDTNQVTDLEA